MDGSRRCWGILTLQALDTTDIPASHIKEARQSFLLVGGMGSQRKPCLKVELTTSRSQVANGRFAGVLLVKFSICGESWNGQIPWTMPPNRTFLLNRCGGVC